MRIAVIGLGAVGSQVAWQLSRIEGVEVHGFDTRYPGHDAAGAGGGSRLYRNFELSDLDYAPLIRRADEVWRELERASGRELRRCDGALLVGGEDAPQMRTALASTEVIDKPYEVLSREQIGARFPGLGTFEGDVGLWDAEAGVISPELTVATAAALARGNGAEIREFARVERLESIPGGVRVGTADGTLDCDRAVVACSGWTAELLPELRGEIVARRLTSAWFVGREAGSLRDLPPFMRTAPSYCYGIPTRDGGAMKLGLGFNDHYAVGDPDAAPRALDDAAAREQIDRFSWVLRDLLPGLNPNPVRLSTYMESYTRSMHEYVRLLPSDPNITVLTGFSGHGFKLCTAIGEIGAQLATERGTELDLDFLRDAEPVFEIEDPDTGRATYNPIMSSSRR